MTTSEIYEKANQIFPLYAGNDTAKRERNAYVQGFLDALSSTTASQSQNFFEQVAKGLRELWPPGEKDGKWAWRDSVSNLTRRLQFLWRERELKDKYTVEDCLQAGRRYLSQFENNVKYMQTLKYFIYKEDKIHSASGKVKVTYKSSLADFLEGNSVYATQDEWATMFEASNTIDQGELI